MNFLSPRTSRQLLITIVLVTILHILNNCGSYVRDRNLNINPNFRGSHLTLILLDVFQLESIDVKDFRSRHFFTSLIWFIQGRCHRIEDKRKGHSNRSLLSLCRHAYGIMHVYYIGFGQSIALSGQYRNVELLVTPVDQRKHTRK